MNQTCLQAVIHTSSSISKQDLPNCRRKLWIKTTKFSFAFCLWPPPPLPLCSTWNFRNFQTKHSVWKSRKKVSNYKIRTFNFDYKSIWIFISGDNLGPFWRENSNLYKITCNVKYHFWRQNSNETYLVIFNQSVKSWSSILTSTICPESCSILRCVD